MNRINIPDNWLGEPIKGSIERVLESSSDSEVLPQTSEVRKPSASISGKETYIILEGRQHGSYSYPDLLVPMERTHQGKNWNETWDALKGEGALMLTIRQYVDFLNLLKSSNAYDGNGQKIPEEKLAELFNDITQVRNPWRAEWLDAKFENNVVGKKWGGLADKNLLHIVYHDVNGGSLTEIAEPLQNYLGSDKTPGISLDYWLNNAIEVGLPPSSAESGKLWYWHPRAGRVARFNANSIGAYLICDRNPDSRDASLGVRAVRRADAQN